MKLTEPVSLGKVIDSSGNEGQPVTSPDGKKRYLSSVPNKEITITRPRAQIIDRMSFEKEFETIFNGLPNIWEADISQIRLLKTPKS